MTQRDEPEPDLLQVVADVPLPLLYSLVYCSRAAGSVDDVAVAAIVASAQRFNATQNVTGMLVYGSGVFFQWLEGPRDAVQRVLARLRVDTRHHDICILSELEETRERLFPGWYMEHVGAEDIRVVLTDAKDSAQDPAQAARLAQLLEELDVGQLRGLLPA